MNNDLTKYLTTFLPEKDESIKQIERQAEQDFIPIMDPLAINFLMQIIRMKQPKSILEIGTAIGYSALRMNEAYPNAKITSIEQNHDRVTAAINNINAQNKTEQIKVVHDDALTYMLKLANVNEKFDLVFIDAAKSKYKQFFEAAVSLLCKNGIIITDNVLFKGYVYKNKDAKTKHRKLAKKVDSFNKWLAAHPDFMTSIVPIGDGVAISIKKI